MHMHLGGTHAPDPKQTLRLGPGPEFPRFAEEQGTHESYTIRITTTSLPRGSLECFMTLRLCYLQGESVNNPGSREIIGPGSLSSSLGSQYRILIYVTVFSTWDLDNLAKSVAGVTSTCVPHIQRSDGGGGGGVSLLGERVSDCFDTTLGA